MQGVLEETLSTLARGPVALTVAGRTDAGVHADAQVAHVDVPTTGTALLTTTARCPTAWCAGSRACSRPTSASTR